MDLHYRNDEDDPLQPHSDALHAFTPSVDREAIFRQLIDQELRHGRLNKATRARIVGYACGMGVSATRAGELVRECATEMSRQRHAPEREFALRILNEPQEPDRIATPLLLAIGVATVLLGYMVWHRFF